LSESLAVEQIAPDLFHADPDRALRLAGLVWLAARELYETFPQERNQVLRLIAQQIGAPGGELENTLVLRNHDDIALVSGVAMPGLAAAQANAALAHLRNVDRQQRPDLAARLRAYARQLEPTSGDGLYIARVAVAPDKRGQGLGRRIMLEYLDRAGNVAVHLHAHRDNEPAISLYKSLGFVPRTESRFAFILLTRPT
jgi:ribosomal protein S18 acetylase RimI-like enzyme